MASIERPENRWARNVERLYELQRQVGVEKPVLPDLMFNVPKAGLERLRDLGIITIGGLNNVVYLERLSDEGEQ